MTHDKRLPADRLRQRDATSLLRNGLLRDRRAGAWLADGGRRPRAVGDSGSVADSALRAQSEARDFSLHGRRAVADRSVRSQAGAGRSRRAGHPGGVRQGRAVRVHQGTAEAAGFAIQVPETRTFRRGDLGAAAASLEGRRRPHHRPVDADLAVQSCAGADLHEHRAPGDRPAEPRVVAELRAREREPGSAGVRGADLGRKQSRRRQVVLGIGISADRASGRRVPVGRRSGPLRLEPGRRRRARAGSTRSPPSTISTGCIIATWRTRRFRRGSPPTSWRIACRPACRS